jgi:hypothetical protein
LPPPRSKSCKEIADDAALAASSGLKGVKWVLKSLMVGAYAVLAETPLRPNYIPSGMVDHSTIFVRALHNKALGRLQRPGLP